jgi:hypothetical protein
MASDEYRALVRYSFSAKAHVMAGDEYRALVRYSFSAKAREVFSWRQAAA